MKKIVYTALIFCFSVCAFSQKDVPFEKDYFKDNKSEFKDALKEKEEGDELFAMGRQKYLEAIPFYLRAHKFNPNSAELNYKIGRAYLDGYGSSFKLKSLEYFEKAYKLKPSVAPDILYMIGQGQQLQSKWDDAIKSYKGYQQMMPPDATVNQKANVNKKIEECKNGKKLEEKPIRVFIDNLGGTVNSKYPDYSSMINADGSEMVFTSRRDNTTGGKKDPFIGQYFEDVYITKKVNGNWTSPQVMPKPVNSDGHDSNVGYSPDGQKLLVYIDDKGDGNIYQSNLRGEEWTKPKKLGKNINTKYTENDACFSPDGQILYFVSNKPEDNLGDFDIYMSRWNAEEEEWGPPKNLGPNINTKYGDRSVYMHPNGKTLYFSSQGHNTMGEYDIFSSTLENGEWSEPINIGYPVNTPDDDVYFSIAANGVLGYYTSFKPNGYGEKDLYQITFLGPEKPLMLSNEDNLIASQANPVKEKLIEPMVAVNKNKVTILKGVIRDIKTKQPVEAKIELIDNEKSSLVASFTSNSSTGKYLVSLPAGRNYGIAVKGEGYLFHSENFNIPESAAYQEVTKDVDLKKLEVGNTIVLKNIFFDYDKATIRPESSVELDRLKKLMDENPTLKVEISGHTDNIGSDQYNQKLSESRSQSVVNYLIQKGVSGSRMEYKGYGESKPLASNDTEEGRQLNRRTEFKVLGL